MKLFRWFKDIAFLKQENEKSVERDAQLQKQLNELEQSIKDIKHQQEHDWSNQKIAHSMLRGLLDYLEVDYFFDEVPDLSYMPQEPKMTRVVKIKKNKSKKS